MGVNILKKTSLEKQRKMEKEINISWEMKMLWNGQFWNVRDGNTVLGSMGHEYDPRVSHVLNRNYIFIFIYFYLLFKACIYITGSMTNITYIHHITHNELNPFIGLIIWTGGCISTERIAWTKIQMEIETMSWQQRHSSGNYWVKLQQASDGPSPHESKK